LGCGGCDRVRRIRRACVAPRYLRPCACSDAPRRAAPRAAEKSGFTLSNIERLGLLSKAESLGALSLATDRGTPGKLSGAAVLLLAAAAAVVYFVPDTDTTLLVAQAAGAAVLGAGGVAALVGGSILGNLQK
jgi:hypothetical protein